MGNLSGVRFKPALMIHFKFFPDHRKSFENIHRSGWRHAMDILEQSDLFKPSPRAIIFDSYVDRTFHMKEMRHCIPYKKRWVGCVHHTFDETHSLSNNMELLRNEFFLQSLKKCLGLFVFSRYQKDLWDRAFWEKGIDVIVSVINHPTEPVTKDQTFNPQLFIDNNQRGIIQIGAWLRDAFAIYRLPSKLALQKGKDRLPIAKKAVKGMGMDSYFVPRRFMGWLGNSIDEYWGYGKYGSVTTSEAGVYQTRSDVSKVSSGASLCGKPPMEMPPVGVMCRNATRNHFLHYLVEHMENLIDHVEIIGYLNNDDYDEMLTKNIVFLRLVDASAVNTVLECMVRRTPFFINRGLKAVEERIGVEYPLYYDSVYDIPDMLTVANIERAYKYLKDLSVDELTGEAFLDSIRYSAVFSKCVVNSPPPYPY
jgi:hypothetical protein